jgi:hypothetical protein
MRIVAIARFLARPFGQPLSAQGVAERVVTPEAKRVLCVLLYLAPEAEQCAVISALQADFLSVFHELHGYLPTSLGSLLFDAISG